MQPDVREGETAFSYHRKNGFAGMLVAVGIAGVAETVGVHLLVERWSDAAAWAVSALSLYGLTWIVGYYHSVRLRPILIAPDALRVRVGLLWEARVPYAEILSVQPIGREGADRETKNYFQAVPLGPASLVVELRRPAEARGPYGYVRRGIRRIGVAPDERDRFVAELTGRLEAAHRAQG